MPESQGSAAFRVVEERKGSGNFRQNSCKVPSQESYSKSKGIASTFSSDPWQPGTLGPFFSMHEIETGESLGFALH